MTIPALKTAVSAAVTLEDGSTHGTSHSCYGHPLGKERRRKSEVGILSIMAAPIDKTSDVSNETDHRDTSSVNDSQKITVVRSHLLRLLFLQWVSHSAHSPMNRIRSLI
jgi:hypothetical protein